jgi:hypothetical protein
MALRRPIKVLASMALVSLCAGLFAATTAAAPRDSIKLLVLPKPLHVGRVTILLTGYASGTKPEVSLYSSPQACRSSFTNETKFHDLTIWIDGGHVHGNYRYTDKVAGFSEPTHGAQHFCAYLTSFTPKFSYITQAHESMRFSVTS